MRNVTDKKAADRQETRESVIASEGSDLQLESWLPYRFSVLANRVSACLFEMYNQQYGLSVAGWRIMALLGARQPLSAKEVAQYVAMDQVSVTRAINQMDTLGLITRRIDENDRRKITLRLSKKGETARGEIIPLAIALEKAMVSSLSEREISTLNVILTKLMAASETEISDPSAWRAVMQKYPDPKDAE